MIGDIGFLGPDDLGDAGLAEPLPLATEASRPARGSPRCRRRRAGGRRPAAPRSGARRARGRGSGWSIPTSDRSALAVGGERERARDDRPRRRESRDRRGIDGSLSGGGRGRVIALSSALASTDMRTPRNKTTPRHDGPFICGLGRWMTRRELDAFRNDPARYIRGMSVGRHPQGRRNRNAEFRRMPTCRGFARAGPGAEQPGVIES